MRHRSDHFFVDRFALEKLVNVMKFTTSMGVIVRAITVKVFVFVALY